VKGKNSVSVNFYYYRAFTWVVGIFEIDRPGRPIKIPDLGQGLAHRLPLGHQIAGKTASVAYRLQQQTAGVPGKSRRLIGKPPECLVIHLNEFFIQARGVARGIIANEEAPLAVVAAISQAARIGVCMSRHGC